MQVFGDRYEVTGELGHGGMAPLYRARDNRQGAMWPSR
jgi:hypothetical protein